MKALRHIKNGELYPMNDILAKHPDIEFVDLDDDGNVIEPEEVGPAAELKAEDEVKAETKPAPSRTRKKAATEE